MKNRLIGILASAVVLISATAIAGDSSLFLMKCGSCHKKGGEAAPVNPADKAGVVWKKFFKRGRHRIELSDSMSSDDLENVIEYLVDHAADSDKPEAAAIPK